MRLAGARGAGRDRGDLQQLALSALDGAACELQVTREDLVLSLADPEGRAAFLDEREISDETLEAAVSGGLQRAYDDAVAVGAIDGLEAIVIGEAIQRVPWTCSSTSPSRRPARRQRRCSASSGRARGASEALDTLEGLLD